MDNPFISKIGHTPFVFKGHLQKPQVTPEVSFQTLLGNTWNGVNAMTNQPDALLKQSLETGKVDVHEIMVAQAKAELAVNMTTGMVTKVIQAYDRILQIQI
jgi:flagellar hook-basal body complex protein FliE